MISVLFVCSGNICRSPTAHGVFETLLAQHKIGHIHVDSCGIYDWNVGKAADPRTIETAKKYGYDLTNQRARAITKSDLETFDYLIAMDDSHVQSMIDMGADPDRVLLMMQFLEGKSDQNVPDPYYGGQEGFDHVFECIEEACQALLKKLSQ